MSGRLQSCQAIVLAAILLAGAKTGRTDAGPATAPFLFWASATAGTDGNDMVIRVEPNPTRRSASVEPFDLYIIQLTSFETALFLTPAGLWSHVPTPLRQGLVATAFAPLRVRWSESQFQLGTMHLLIIATKPSSDPRLRSNWMFRPELQIVRLKGRLSNEQSQWAMLTIGSLGILTLLAAAMVLRYPRG
jgi:hypothetical protein